jgi:peptidoglycan/xylan/chitin deacetylase (PgdA/CDA1 family)
MSDTQDGSSEESGQFVVRRYQAVGLILAGVLLSSVALFSRDSEFFSFQPRYPYRIALTFDDGPHPAFTDRLVHVLAQHRAVGTFFVVGSQVRRYPGLLRELATHGNEIANHTYDHLNLTTLSADQIRTELDDTRRLIEQITEKRCALFRPPGGRYDEKTLDIAAHNGYHMVLWTVFPRDHESPPPEEIYRRVMASAADGGVVLMHSGIESTLDVLPRIIEDLRAKGFQFLTISEMLDEGINPRVLASWYLPKTLPSPFYESTVQSGGRKPSVPS